MNHGSVQQLVYFPCTPDRLCYDTPDRLSTFGSNTRHGRLPTLGSNTLCNRLPTLGSNTLCGRLPTLTSNTSPPSPSKDRAVCHGRGDYPYDFFYVYATMFKDLKVLLPFTDFQMGVLKTLNLAPTQLHPNGWAFMQAFVAICSGLALKPTLAAFLYFFHVQPHPTKPWVSVRTVGNKHMLTLYNSSYKDLKITFLKSCRRSLATRVFATPAPPGMPSFLFTGDPRKVLSWPKPQMSTEDLDLINQLCQLPPKSSCRVLIGFLGNKNLPSNVFDYLAKMDPSRNNTFARLFAQRGGEVRKPSGGASPAPSVVAEPATSRKVQKASIPPAVVEVPSQQTSPAPPLEAECKKKGKRKAAKETSAESKRLKRHLPDGPPLTRLLSPNVWVAKRLHFDIFTEEKALVSGMTEEEASNMALELAARSAMCLSYAAEKRASASTERMAEEDKKKASTLLAEARAAQRRMQRSLDDVQLDLQKATASNSTLTVERDSLLARVTELDARVTEVEAENKLLGDEVVNEHLLGFDKALAQCRLLFQVPTDDPRLDVSLMVVDNQLVPINDPPPSTPVVQNANAEVEAIGETDEAPGSA
ncbi:hypothetical protein LR48_Vigan11g108900 [Vigna angularis]|uniref:Transposase (putative) gypsy type domain-containing protein n=1 Tax=Phaseolus angularis TaxID=3914 RepID=A0A0L9VSK8_PHAAN|nr:hypothetical protein LR48_Vigan11g108900 [Vigna angularis]